MNTTCMPNPQKRLGNVETTTKNKQTNKQKKKKKKKKKKKTRTSFPASTA